MLQLTQPVSLILIFMEHQWSNYSLGGVGLFYHLTPEKVGATLTSETTILGPPEVSLIKRRGSSYLDQTTWAWPPDKTRTDSTKIRPPDYTITDPTRASRQLESIELIHPNQFKETPFVNKKRGPGREITFYKILSFTILN